MQPIDPNKASNMSYISNISKIQANTNNATNYFPPEWQKDILHTKKELNLKTLNIDQQDVLDVMQNGDLNIEKNDDQIKKDIQIAMQGLGCTKAINRNGVTINFYICSEYCEQNLKILCRLLRKDKPEWPTARLLMGRYNLIGSDLIDILLTQVEDQRMSFWLVILMGYLTTPPPELAAGDDREAIRISNIEAKKQCLRNQVLNTFVIHLSELLMKTTLSYAEMQFLEGILVLFKNLLEIDNDETNNFLSESFLINCWREEILEIFTFILEYKSQVYEPRILLLILDIMFYLLTCIDPNNIYDEQTIFKFPKQNLRNKVFDSKILPKSRFRLQTNQNITRMFNTVSENYGNSGQDNYGMKESDFVPKSHQQLRPTRNYNNKKVKSLFRPYLPPYVFVPKGQNGKSFRQNAQRTLSDLLLGKILHNLFAQIQSIFKMKDPFVTTQHRMKYFLLMKWTFDIVISSYYYKKERINTVIQRELLSYQISNIESLISPEYNLIELHLALYIETNKQKKSQFDINYFHAALIAFDAYLRIVYQLSCSNDALQVNYGKDVGRQILKLEITRIFRQGFNRVHHYQILKKLIEATHKYFQILSKIGQGRLLTCNLKPIKKKYHKDKFQKEEQHILSDDDLDEDLNDQQNKNNVELQYQPKQFKHRTRQYTQKSQFSYMADYDVIKKYLSFLQGSSYLDNDHEFTCMIFDYCRRIVDMLNAPWLFFQADFLFVLQRLLNDKVYMEKFAPYSFWINTVVSMFQQLLNRNPLTIVEILFRWDTMELKDAILNNYKDFNFENILPKEQQSEKEDNKVLREEKREEERDELSSEEKNRKEISRKKSEEWVSDDDDE